MNCSNQDMPTDHRFWTILINQKTFSINPRLVVLVLSGFSAILIIACAIFTQAVPTFKTYPVETSKYSLRISPGVGENRANSSDDPTCPDILSGMASGRWKKRALSNQEQKDIDSYLREERRAFHMPLNFQRFDGKCGNVSYEHAPLYRHMWFKAICDSHGSTPCCKENRCVSATEQDCQCDECYDERQAIHAEYAEWETTDKRCAVGNFSAHQACSVLRGANLEFVGDSFVRHMFAATVIRLSGDTEFSALVKPLPTGIQHICRGMHQFTALQCRDYLKEEHSLCNNTVQIRYTQVFPASDFLFVPQILDRAFQSPRSLLVMGLGIHDDFKFDTVRKGFLLPVLNLRQYMAGFPRNTRSDNVYLDLGSVRTNFTAHNTTLDFLVPRNFQDESFPKPQLEALLHTHFLDKSFFSLNKHNTETTKQTVLNRSHDDSSLTYASFEGEKGGNLAGNSIVFQELPDVKLKAQQTSPNIIWVGTHAPGLLKAPKFARQTAKGVSDYNKKVQKLLEKWKTPFMDTFPFSNGAVSYDGTHFGWGINMMKVNMLVQYIRDDLSRSKSWR